MDGEVIEKKIEDFLKVGVEEDSNLYYLKNERNDFITGEFGEDDDKKNYYFIRANNGNFYRVDEYNNLLKEDGRFISSKYTKANYILAIDNTGFLKSRTEDNLDGGLTWPDDSDNFPEKVNITKIKGVAIDGDEMERDLPSFLKAVESSCNDEDSDKGKLTEIVNTAIENRINSYEQQLNRKAEELGKAEAEKIKLEKKIEKLEKKKKRQEKAIEKKEKILQNTEDEKEKVKALQDKARAEGLLAKLEQELTVKKQKLINKNQELKDKNQELTKIINSREEIEKTKLEANKLIKEKEVEKAEKLDLAIEKNAKNLLAKQQELAAAKKALNLFDKDKEIRAKEIELKTAEKKHKELTNNKEAKEEELTKKLELEKVGLDKAQAQGDQTKIEEAKKNVKIAENNLEIFKREKEIQILANKINDKKAELTEKEQKFKDKEKTALATNKQEDINAAKKAKEEAEKIRGELEIFKGQNEVFKKQKDVLKKESEVLEDPNKKEELTDAKLGLIISQKELEVLKATDESVKAKAEKELNEIQEIQRKAGGTVDTTHTIVKQELEKAEIELAKAQVDELTDADPGKQKLQKAVKDKKKNLAAARKKLNKEEVPELKELGNLPKPDYSTCANSNKLTVLAITGKNNNTTPLEKTITVNGQEKKLNYLKYNDNYYLVDEDNNIVNEKGEQINYGGDYHYAIDNTNGNLKLVNNSDETDYLIIRNNKIFKKDNSTEYINNINTYNTAISILTEKQVDVDEIGVYEKQDDVLKSIETYYTDGFKKLDDSTKGKILELDKKLSDIKQAKPQNDNEREKLKQQQKETEVKLKVCETQKKFLEAAQNNFNSLATKDQEKIKESYKHLKEFEDISNKITELSQNFDYGNPALNDKNIAAIEGLVGLVERKAELEKKQQAINESREKLRKNTGLDNEAIEDLKNSLDEQQKTLDEAYKDITSEQAEIIGEIEKFNNIDENDTDELSKATEAIKNSIKSIEEKSEVEKKIKDLEAKSKNYERSMEWLSVSDKGELDEYIKNHFDGDPKKFVDDYNNEDNKKFYKENKFTKEHGGIDTVIKAMEGTVKFTDAVGLKEAGYTIKEKRWYRSKENKALIAAQETYDKNVDKIDRLKKENEELRKHMDPFENEYSDNLLTAIQKEGIHLPKTRKDAGMLFDDIKGDCIKDFLGIKNDEKLTQEMEQLFNSLTPEERTSLFEKFLTDNLINNNNSKYDKYSQDAKNLLIDTFKKREEESFKQIAINNKAIDLTKDKNLEIVKNTKNIIDKKLTKVQYKKDKETYKQLKRENTLESNLQAQKMAQDLKNKKDELNEKKLLIKNAEASISEIKNRSTTFRKNIEDKETLKDNLKSLSMKSAQQKVNTYKQQKVNQSKTKSGSNISFP